MACSHIIFLSVVLLLASAFAAPADITPKEVKNQDLQASEKEDLSTAASHWGGWGGYGGYGHYGGYYPHYGSYGWPSYGYGGYGGYGWGWPYGGYYGNHGYWW